MSKIKIKSRQRRKAKRKVYQKLGKQMKKIS